MNKILIAGMVLFLSACGGNNADEIINDAKKGNLSVGERVKFDGKITDIKKSQYGDSIEFGLDAEKKNGALLAMVLNSDEFQIDNNVKADCSVAKYGSDEFLTVVVVNQCSFVK